MRTFVLLSLAAAAVCVDTQCLEDIAKTVEDVAAAGETVKTVIEACQNSTQTACVAGVTKLAASLQVVANEAVQVSETCAGVSAQCGTDVDGTVASLKDSVTTITSAITDCGNSTKKAECVVDVLDTADALGHAAFDIYKATFDCNKNSTGPVDNCATEVVEAVEDARKSAESIKAAVEACKHKKDCIGALEAATNSCAATAEEASKAAAKCGGKSVAGQCITDVSGAADSLLEAARKGEAAKAVCDKGTFHFIKCMEDVLAIASDVVHAAGDVVAATSQCKTI